MVLIIPYLFQHFACLGSLAGIILSEYMYTYIVASFSSHAGLFEHRPFKLHLHQSGCLNSNQDAFFANSPTAAGACVLQFVYMQARQEATYGIGAKSRTPQ